jgi:hypothetical protein
MQVEGIVSQDGTTTVTYIEKLQVIHFKHTKLDKSVRVGYELRALPGNEKLGEFIDYNEAEAAKEKIVGKVRRLGKRAFVLVPEDKAALRKEREQWQS